MWILYELSTTIYPTKDNTNIQGWISTYIGKGLDTNEKENGNDEEHR